MLGTTWGARGLTALLFDDPLRDAVKDRDLVRERVDVLVHEYEFGRAVLHHVCSGHVVE